MARQNIFSPLLQLKKEEEFIWESEDQKDFNEIKMYLSNPSILLTPERNKPMKLYISASHSTIGNMLAQEDSDAFEKAIYYLIRVLNDAGTRYNAIEKLCICLYFFCTMLKHYIKLTDVFV